MTSAEKLDLVSSDLARTMRELDAAKELIAVLFAELALPSDDPAGYIAEIEEEQKMTYAAATEHDEIPEALRRTLVVKAEYKTSIFALARMVLTRLASTR